MDSGIANVQRSTACCLVAENWGIYRGGESLIAAYLAGSANTGQTLRRPGASGAHSRSSLPTRPPLAPMPAPLSNWVPPCSQHTCVRTAVRPLLAPWGSPWDAWALADRAGDVVLLDTPCPTKSQLRSADRPRPTANRQATDWSGQGGRRTGRASRAGREGGAKEPVFNRTVGVPIGLRPREPRSGLLQSPPPRRPVVLHRRSYVKISRMLRPDCRSVPCGEGRAPRVSPVPRSSGSCGRSEARRRPNSPATSKSSLGSRSIHGRVNGLAPAGSWPAA